MVSELAAAAGGSVRCGIDTVEIIRIERLLRDTPPADLGKLFSAHELEDAGDGPGRAGSLAARFAAKEAALKVLRPRDGGIPWSAIEVRRDPGGWVEMELSGAAADLAEAAGVAELAVSLSHEGGFASAVVIAELRPSSR